MNSRSLMQKMLLGYLFLGLVPLVLFSNFLINAIGEYMQDYLINDVTQTTLYISRNLSDMFSEYDSLTKSMYDYRSTDGHYLHSLIKDNVVTDSECRANINHMLADILYQNTDIQSLFFITETNNYSASRTHTKSTRDFCFQDFANLEKDKLHVYVNGNQSLFLLRFYKNTESVLSAQEQALGILIMEIDFNCITNLFTPMMSTRHQQFYLADANLSPIYSSGSNTYTVDIQSAFSKFTEWNDSGVTKYNKDYLVYRKISTANWLLFTTVPYALVNPTSFLFNSRVVILFVITLIFLIMAYFLFSNKITTPVKEITEAMRRIEHGDLSIELHSNSKDEFSEIMHSLNGMVRNLKSYIDQAYIYEIRQREAELDALKLQIRPHYLYNSLEIIRMIALESNAELVADMITNLSEQMEYLTERNSDTVPLQYELANAQDYFQFASMRHEGRYTLIINIPETLYMAQIPRLILQPLIENSIIHGFPNDRKGTIQITAKQVDDDLHLRIMDDGIGMEANIVDYLNNHNKTNDDGSYSRIGLVNVIDRIHLRYNNTAIVKITSMKDIGTAILIRVPLELKE